MEDILSILSEGIPYLEQLEDLTIKILLQSEEDYPQFHERIKKWRVKNPREYLDIVLHKILFRVHEALIEKFGFPSGLEIQGDRFNLGEAYYIIRGTAIYGIPGLSKEILDKGNLSPGKACPICFLEEDLGFLSCRHPICGSCYKKVFQCPLCRSEILKITTIEEVVAKFFQVSS